MKKERLILLGAFVMLLTGFGSAVAIYLNAAPEAENPLGYDPQDTKMYLLKMEEYGGKSNVLATELTEWFHDIWHGRSLAYTVAVLSLALYLVIWYIATRQPSGEASGGGSRPGPS